MHSFGQNSRVHYYIDLRTVERFSNVSKLTELLESVKEVGLSKREAFAIKAFRIALERRHKGVPDESPRNFSDECSEEI